jgi:hypothetical protein
VGWGEIFVVRGRKTAAVDPGRALIGRADVDGTGEGHDADLDFVAALIARVKHAREVLGRHDEIVEGLARHRAGIVEHQRHLDRTLALLDGRTRAEADVLDADGLEQAGQHVALGRGDDLAFVGVHHHALEDAHVFVFAGVHLEIGIGILAAGDVLVGQAKPV